MGGVKFSLGGSVEGRAGLFFCILNHKRAC